MDFLFFFASCLSRPQKAQFCTFSNYTHYIRFTLIGKMDCSGSDCNWSAVK